jgi:hypothetical protein
MVTLKIVELSNSAQNVSSCHGAKWLLTVKACLLFFFLRKCFPSSFAAGVGRDPFLCIALRIF